MADKIKPPVSNPISRTTVPSIPQPVTPSVPPKTSGPDAGSQKAPPNLAQFRAITHARPPVARGIFGGNSNPISVGGVQFASTAHAIDQIIVENGAETNISLLQAAYDAVLS